MPPSVLCRSQKSGSIRNSNPHIQCASSDSGAFVNQVLGGKRIVFSAMAVQNEPNRDVVFRRRIEQAGGTYISGLSLGANGVTKEILQDAHVFITLYQENGEYELVSIFVMYIHAIV